MSAVAVCLTLSLLGAATAAVAAARGFEAAQWFVAGVVAGPLPLLLLWALPRRRPGP